MQTLINVVGTVFTVIILADISLGIGLMNTLGYIILLAVSTGMMSFKIRE